MTEYVDKHELLDLFESGYVPKHRGKEFKDNEY